MQIAILAVGRMKAGPERDLSARYFERLAKAGPALGLEFAGLREIPESRATSVQARRAEESARLLSLAPETTLCLLDEHGRDRTSLELAEWIATRRDGGTRSLAFAIGGADGHDAALREKAELVLSFGRQTWPHQLVRIMLAEQLYRVATILSGHPYHRA
jgi:23S rRNA (pseudouridine1915-N3)-methyltransferase